MHHNKKIVYRGADVPFSINVNSLLEFQKSFDKWITTLSDLNKVGGNGWNEVSYMYLFNCFYICIHIISHALFGIILYDQLNTKWDAFEKDTQLDSQKIRQSIIYMEVKSILYSEIESLQ